MKETRHVNKYTQFCRQVNPLKQERCRLLSCLRVYLNSKVHPVRLGWIKLLSRYEWTWYTTLTFRDLPKTYTAINRAKKWLRGIERAEKRHVPYYLCLEFTKRLGIPHLHLLMANLDGVYAKKWFNVWLEKWGGAYIDRYNCERGGIPYLCKYVMKDVYRSGYFEIHDLHRAIQIPLYLGRQKSTIDKEK